MTNNIFQDVKEFRRIFGLHCAKVPNLAPDTSLRLHHKLLTEEMSELYTAIQERDPEEFLDALGDLVYLAIGAAAECGYDLEEALRRIHAANMNKLVDGVVNRRADGKVLKPEGWQPPSHSDLVR